MSNLELTIKSQHGGTLNFRRSGYYGGTDTHPYHVTLASELGSEARGWFNEADLIRLVETVLDGKFIRHADLPEVESDSDGDYETHVGSFVWNEDPAEQVEEDALRLFAIARHKAGPPVDERRVSELTDLLAEAYSGAQNDREAARNLVLAGVTVTPNTPKD